MDRTEVERFDRMGEQLRAQHPVPGARLPERLHAGPEADTPPKLPLQVVLAVLFGLLLLGVAALGASGSGPLGG